MIEIKYFPLEPRRLLLFLLSKKVNKKNMSAASASLKIGYTSLKRRNLPSASNSLPFYTPFLRFS